MNLLQRAGYAFAKVALFIIQLEANYTIDERTGDYCVDSVVNINCLVRFCSCGLELLWGPLDFQKNKWNN